MNSPETTRLIEAADEIIRESKEGIYFTDTLEELEAAASAARGAREERCVCGKTAKECAVTDCKPEQPKARSEASIPALSEALRFLNDAAKLALSEPANFRAIFALSQAVEATDKTLSGTKHAQRAIAQDGAEGKV